MTHQTRAARSSRPTRSDSGRSSAVRQLPGSDVLSGLMARGEGNDPARVTLPRPPPKLGLDCRDAGNTLAPCAPGPEPAGVDPSDARSPERSAGEPAWRASGEPARVRFPRPSVSGHKKAPRLVTNLGVSWSRRESNPRPRIDPAAPLRACSAVPVSSLRRPADRLSGTSPGGSRRTRAEAPRTSQPDLIDASESASGGLRRRQARKV